MVHRLTEGWALLGGALLMGIVLMNAYSIGSDILISKPFSGDFELTEVGIAVAAFCFLPYCQMTGSNVTADLFTAKAGPFQLMLMRLFAGFVALGFSSLLLWRMWDGLADYREYEEVTGILSFPLWIAFIPCLMSLALLVASCLMTIIDIFGTRKRA